MPVPISVGAVDIQFWRMSSMFKSVSVLLLVFAPYGQMCVAQADAPKNVTLHELTANPKKFDGEFVRVRASALMGWEGDNFLVEPREFSPTKRKFTDSSVALVWIECLSDNECNGLMGLEYGSGTITGRFHYVPSRAGRIGNRVFDPGPFQLEIIRISEVKYGDWLTEPWFSPVR
jgi:hypothetical protein